MFLFRWLVHIRLNKWHSWHFFSIILLAICSAAGGFSLSDVLVEPAAISEFVSVRNLALAGALIAAFMARRPNDPVTAMGAVMAVALAMLAAYGVALTGLALNGPAAWRSIEQVPALAMNVLLTVWLVRSRQDAQLFLGTLAVLIALAGFSIGLVELADSRAMPLVPFFSSRTLIVGAMILLFFACTSTRTPAAAVLAAAAFVLIFVGLTSNMRVAALFYVIAWLIACLQLTAHRKYRAAVLGTFILALAYLAHGAVNGTRAVDKWNAYSPTVVREDAPPAAPVDVSACLDKSADLREGRTPAAPELRYMCNRFFSIDDQDARIRLILHAIASNPSPVFGAGFGRYAFIDAARPRSPADRYTYPHNILAETYHATGLIGLGLIGLSIAAAIVIALRACMASPMPVGVLMTIPAFTAMASMTGGNLYDARLLWVLPIAMAALSSKHSGTEKVV